MLEVTVGWDSWEMIKFAPSPVKMDEDLTYTRLGKPSIVKKKIFCEIIS